MFPFEPPLYEKAGVPVTYVGHPLADLIPLEPDRLEARAALRLPPGKLIVALLPGSRRSELQYMAQSFVLAAHRFRQEVADVHFVCPTVTRDTRDMFERAVHENKRTDLPLTLLLVIRTRRSPRPTSRWWRAAPRPSKPRFSRRRW